MLPTLFTPDQLLEKEAEEAEKKKRIPARRRGIPQKGVTSADFLKLYKQKCTSLDAYTFGDVKKEIQDALQNGACPDTIKLMFGDWFFRKIHMYYKPPETERRPLCSNLISPITGSQQPIVKSAYLKFHNVEALVDLCEHFFLNRFSDHDRFFIIQMLNDVQLTKNLRSRSKRNELKNHFLKWLEASEAHEQKSNLLDSLLREFPGDAQVKKVHQIMKYGEGGDKAGNRTVYSNQQNVHALDKKCVAKAQQLVEDVHNTFVDKEDIEIMFGKRKNGEKVPGIDKINQLKRKLELGAEWKDGMTTRLRIFFKTLSKPNTTEVVKCIIERMIVDQQRFGSISFSTADLLTALVAYITEYNKTHIVEKFFGTYIIKEEKADKIKGCQDTLKERLFEELDDMKELCISGYVSRLINVLSGFDQRYTVQMDFKKQLYAVISNKVAPLIENAPEEVLEGSYDEEYEDDYLQFIQDIVNKHLASIINDYGKEDVLNNVCDVLKKFSGKDRWSFDHEAQQVKFR